MIARSVSFGTRWCIVFGDGEENDEAEGKGESERAKVWSGVGVVFSIFGGWATEPDGWRLTKPR